MTSSTLLVCVLLGLVFCFKISWCYDYGYDFGDLDSPIGGPGDDLDLDGYGEHIGDDDVPVGPPAPAPAPDEAPAAPWYNDDYGDAYYVPDELIDNFGSPGVLFDMYGGAYGDPYSYDGYNYGGGNYDGYDSGGGGGGSSAAGSNFQVDCGSSSSDPMKIIYYGIANKIFPDTEDPWMCPVNRPNDFSWIIPDARLPECGVKHDEAASVYYVDIVAQLGRARHHTDPVYTAQCVYERTQFSEERPGGTIDDSFVPISATMYNLGDNATGTFELKLTDLYRNPVTEPILGHLLRLVITYDNGPGEDGFKVWNCRAKEDHHDEKEYFILAAGCGDGRVLMSHRGFVSVSPTLAVSPPFRAFQLTPSRDVFFMCEFIICKDFTHCKGTSCHTDLKKRRKKRRRRRSSGSVHPVHRADPLPVNISTPFHNPDTQVFSDGLASADSQVIDILPINYVPASPDLVGPHQVNKDDLVVAPNSGANDKETFMDSNNDRYTATPVGKGEVNVLPQQQGLSMMHYVTVGCLTAFALGTLLLSCFLIVLLRKKREAVPPYPRIRQPGQHQEEGLDTIRERRQRRTERRERDLPTLQAGPAPGPSRFTQPRESIGGTDEMIWPRAEARLVET